MQWKWDVSSDPHLSSTAAVNTSPSYPVTSVTVKLKGNPLTSVVQHWLFHKIHPCALLHDVRTHKVSKQLQYDIVNLVLQSIKHKPHCLWWCVASETSVGLRFNIPPHKINPVPLHLITFLQLDSQISANSGIQGRCISLIKRELQASCWMTGFAFLSPMHWSRLVYTITDLAVRLSLLSLKT